MTRLSLRTEKDWDLFTRSAAPEAIAAYLKAERAALARQADVVSRLEVLLARRCREVADGDWPPPRPVHYRTGALTFACGVHDGLFAMDRRRVTCEACKATPAWRPDLETL